MNAAPNILLSTGRVVKHTPEPNGSQRATPTPGPKAMTPEEWIEYCSVVRQQAPDPFAFKIKTSAALRAGTDFLRKP